MIGLLIVTAMFMCDKEIKQTNLLTLFKNSLSQKQLCHVLSWNVISTTSLLLGKRTEIEQSGVVATAFSVCCISALSKLWMQEIHVNQLT